MMSGKFCCKPCWPVIRKDLTRFWPVWASYLALWTLLLPVRLIHMLRFPGDLAAMVRQAESARRMVLSLGQTTGLLLSCAYGLICAMAVWSYLFSARSASLYHALPVTRESLFLSHWLAGLSFSLLPSALIALLSLLCAAAAGAPGLSQAILLWLGACCLQQLLFFSIGTFAAMLTGNLPALAVLYGVLNFGVSLCELLTGQIAVLFLRGVTSLPRTLTFLSPPVRLLLGSQSYWGSGGGASPQDLQYPLLLAYGAGALALSLLALLLYRRRPTECAGDVIAVPALRPVIQGCFTLGCSLVLGWFFWLLLFQQAEHWAFLLVSLLLGGAMGYFAAAMLLKKSFRVFYKKQWLGLGVFALALCLAVAGLVNDLFGVVRRVPAAEEIQKAELSSGSYAAELTQPEQLEALTALHRTLLALPEAEPGAEGQDTAWVQLDYTLRDGTLLSRSYLLGYSRQDLLDPSSPICRLGALLQDPEGTVGALLPADASLYALEFSVYAPSPLTFVSPASDAPVEDGWIYLEDPAELALLIQALRQDMLTHGLGSWRPDWTEKDAYLTVYLCGTETGTELLTAYEPSELLETLAALRQLGYLKEEGMSHD